MAENEEKDLKKMHESAQKIVLKFVTSTSATGVLTIPLADITLQIGQQVAMLKSISTVYKINVSKNKLNTLVMVVLGVGGTAIVGRNVAATLAKMIPIIGPFAGQVISVGTAGTLTLALGNAYMEVCEAVKKGELEEDDLTKKKGSDLLKRLFMEYFEKEEAKKKSKEESVKNEAEPAKESCEESEEEFVDFGEI